jgi:hypothetical protein
MAKHYFNRIFYRNATTIATTATMTGTYPDYLVTGWTAVVGGIADKGKLGLDADAKEVMGDGTELTSSEKIPVEIIVKNFTAANYATLRTACLNAKLDFLFMDADQPTLCYAAFGVRAYPKIDITGGEEPTLTIAGERKIGAGVTNTPFQMVTVST